MNEYDRYCVMPLPPSAWAVVDTWTNEMRDVVSVHSTKAAAARAAQLRNDRLDRLPPPTLDPTR